MGALHLLYLYASGGGGGEGGVDECRAEASRSPGGKARVISEKDPRMIPPKRRMTHVVVLIVR